MIAGRIGEAGYSPKLADYLRKVADKLGPYQLPINVFCCSNFDANTSRLFLICETAIQPAYYSMSRAIMQSLRVDEGAAKVLMTSALDPDATDRQRLAHSRIRQPTTKRISPSRLILNKMITSLDSTHHYWLNTFTHGLTANIPEYEHFCISAVDLQYLWPKGNNSVWVAPSEEIYSYLLVRNQIKVSFTFMDPNLNPRQLQLVSLQQFQHHLYKFQHQPLRVPTRVPTLDSVDSCLYFLPMIKTRP